MFILKTVHKIKAIKERDIMGRCDRGANVGKKGKMKIIILDSTPSPGAREKMKKKNIKWLRLSWLCCY